MNDFLGISEFHQINLHLIFLSWPDIDVAIFDNDMSLKYPNIAESYSINLCFCTVFVCFIPYHDFAGHH